MMHSVFQLLAALGVIAGLVWAFTAGTVAVLDDSEKRSIREQVTKIWIGIQEAGPFGIVKAPLLLFSTIVVGVFCALWFSPVWIRILVVVAALPSIVLVLASILALILTPFRRRLHKFVTFLLDRISLREKAAVAVAFAALFTTLIGIVALLTALPTLVR
jgi:hypothetical protein